MLSRLRRQRISDPCADRVRTSDSPSSTSTFALQQLRPTNMPRYSATTTVLPESGFDPVSMECFDQSRLSEGGDDVHGLSGSWLNYGAFSREFFERFGVPSSPPSPTDRKRYSSTIQKALVEDEDTAADPLDKIADPYNFFERWNGQEGVDCCRYWFDMAMAKAKVGRRLSDNVVIRLLGVITYLDAMQIHDLINSFEPDGRPTMTCNQFHILVAFVIAREECSLCQFVYLHADWLYDLFSRNETFAIEHGLALVRVAGLTETHIINVLTRLATSFDRRADRDTFKLVYFLLFDEWDTWRSGRMQESCDANVLEERLAVPGSLCWPFCLAI